MKKLTKLRILLACAAFGIGFAQAEDLEVKALLDRNLSVTTTPHAVAKGFWTMGTSGLLGNGNLMLSIAGFPDNLNVYLGKTDFWAEGATGWHWDSGNVPPGSMNICIPAMAGGAFRMEQDMFLAEVRTAVSKGNDAVLIRAIAPHEADNYVIHELTNRGAMPVEVRIETCTAQHDTDACQFEIAAGAEGEIAWTTRKTPQAGPGLRPGGDRKFRMWAAIGTRVIGAPVKITEIKNSWDRAKKDLDVKAVQDFWIAPGKTVCVLTKVDSNGLPITPDPANPLPGTLKALSTLDGKEADKMIAAHRAWWEAYWRKGYVRLDAEPLVERVWFGALYVLACGNKTGQWPAGCNSWPVDDNVPWGGDYHWNYNNEAPYYGAYASNRIDQTEPYDRTVNEANRFGREQAKSDGGPGTLFHLATAPGHLNEPGTLGQRTHAVEAAQNQINHFYYTYDLEWTWKNYEFFRDVAEYWDWDLEKHKETLPNGSHRYVFVESQPMEQAGNDRFNGITAIAFVRRFYEGMIDITRELNAAGYKTGRDDRDLARWREILLNLSDFPKSFAYGRKVFAWSEQSLNPLLTEQDWVLYPVFPSEQVSLSSPPELLRIARNSLIVKPQYYVEWMNNPPQIFSIAARLAHHPPEILERFNYYFRGLDVGNFKCGGGNFEGAGIAEGIDSFLLQSQERFLRFFPCWDLPEAKFVNLRAAGAFLVSAEKKRGVCQPVTLLSEKGRSCSVLNPWHGKTLTVIASTGQAVQVSAEARPYGQICTFKTEPGIRYTVSAKEGIPDALPYWNAAYRKPVTASSDYRPPNEAANWAAANLTDGTRINTGAGNRGWTSALHETPDHAEWVQVDLGEAVPIKRIDLWALDHGDAWQHTHCTMPFVISSEIDQSYDGFPVDFQVLVSLDGVKWDEVGRRVNACKPAIGDRSSDLKPKDVTGPERVEFASRPIRYVKVQITTLRKTRTFGKYAAALAEIEAVRADVSGPEMVLP